MLSSYGLCSVSCWRTPAHEGVRHWLEQATQEATASASHQAARTCHKARSNLPRRSLLGGLSCAGRGTSRQRRSTLGEVLCLQQGQHVLEHGCLVVGIQYILGLLLLDIPDRALHRPRLRQRASGGRSLSNRLPGCSEALPQCSVHDRGSGLSCCPLRPLRGEAFGNTLSATSIIDPRTGSCGSLVRWDGVLSKVLEDRVRGRLDRVLDVGIGPWIKERTRAKIPVCTCGGSDRISHLRRASEYICLPLLLRRCEASHRLAPGRRSECATRELLIPRHGQINQALLL